MAVVHVQRPAMATRFEMWLAGDDSEHLMAVGNAAFEEIERVERVLSRFDPTAEVARLNRLGASGPQQVDYELFAVLEDCRQWLEETEGYFDVSVGSGVAFRDGVQLDASRRTVQFLDPRVRLDLGAFGKGYALDAAARILDRYAVSSALLHGGTSSVLAIGMRDDGAPWPVAIRDPFADGDRALIHLPLTDCALSTSAVFHPGETETDILSPISGERLQHKAACVVIGETAAEAEVLSTALLAMGRSKAAEYCDRRRGTVPLRLGVGWIDADETQGEPVAVEWLVAPAMLDAQNPVSPDTAQGNETEPP